MKKLLKRILHYFKQRKQIRDYIHSQAYIDKVEAFLKHIRTLPIEEQIQIKNDLLNEENID